MNKNLKKKWVAALRSGEYEQGRGRLCEDNKYCCLGVLADIEGKLKKEDDDGRGYIIRQSYLPDAGFVRDHITLSNSYIEKIGLSDADVDKLISMNDYGNKSFNQIADYIEENH